MLLPNRKRILAIVMFALACTHRTPAQVSPSTILEIDVENFVQYVRDITDLSKIGTDPNVAPSTVPNLPRAFWQTVAIGDIVAVNGQPVKGTFTENLQRIGLRPVPNPGESIADTNRNLIQIQNVEILKFDETPIGTIITSGLGGGSAPPGAPLSVTQGNNAIVGGTGAFLGVRGQIGQAVTAQTIPVRQASMAEDPANRRRNGGGKVHFVLQLFPMSQPQILTTAAGPAVTHSSDFTLVTASKPAAAGETLSLFATGLGPTRPGVNPGQPFPSNSPATVNSPVQVTVNGKSADVLAAVGFPGAVDSYQVNFQVPLDTAKGQATVQLSAAWIGGPVVFIMIQ